MNRFGIFPLLIPIIFLISACNLPGSDGIEPVTPTPHAVVANPTEPPTPTETPDPFPNPVAIVMGEAEVVFDWNNDNCEAENLPDLPTRAFRDADGQVNMILSHYVNYRAVGPDLNNLTMDCNKVMGSSKNADPALFSDNEWIGSTYTEDGQTVYALIHNEHQGHLHSGQCPQGEYFPCWYNTVTIVKSIDAGKTFSHLGEPPDHLIASLPYPYIAGDGPNGIRSPSNIIKGVDGFYYSYLGVAEIKPSEQWVCLMRTDDLEDPKSWRFWDGTGFEGQFINPYNDKGESHKCPPLEWDNIGASLNDSITYNTYLERYVLIGVSADWLEYEDREVWGFFYAFSDDLMNWTRRKLLLELPLPWTVEHHTHTNHLYPSLLDPDSESRNFETTDNTAYLYYTRLNFGQGSLDRDLIRVPVEFFPEPNAVPTQSPPETSVPIVEAPNSFESAIGDWEATDIDGSLLLMTISKESEDNYTVNFFDDGTTVCGEDASGNLYAADGLGTATTATSDLIVGLEITCLTSPPSVLRVYEMVLLYDSGSDTISDNWGDSWQRAR